MPIPEQRMTQRIEKLLAFIEKNPGCLLLPLRNKFALFCGIKPAIVTRYLKSMVYAGLICENNGKLYVVEKDEREKGMYDFEAV